MAQAANVNLIDHSEEIIGEMRENVVDWLYAIGLDAASTAANMPNFPVDTGRLRNSISNAVDEEELAAYIGTNVPYAPYQEFGTSRGIEGKHFIQFGATAHAQEYKQMLEERLKGE